MTDRTPPMPPAVAALTRDRTGRPIPYIAEWTRPDGDPTTNHPAYGLMADCHCEIGQGEPDFGELCCKRSFTAMTERLCGTCGQPFTDGERMWWASIDTRPLYNEPANHAACLLFARGICPFLLKQQTDPVERLVVATGYELAFGRDHDGEHILMTPNVPTEMHRSVGRVTNIYAVPNDARRMRPDKAVAYIMRQQS